jgi:hypothetical protein
MNWTRIGLAILASGVVASLTDWLFMGVLFHEKYLAFPEVWRKKPGEPETLLIVCSQIVGLASCIVFVLVGARFELHTWSSLLKFASANWAMGPFPILIQNGMWMKVHPQITAAHLTGWLARLAVCAAAVMLILV